MLQAGHGGIRAALGVLGAGLVLAPDLTTLSGHRLPTMGRNRLLPRLRSRNHEWLLRAARAGSAVVVAAITGGGVLAATHGKHSDELWKVALVAVAVLAVVGVAALLIGGVGAFLTRPVREDHGATLKASAQTLSQSLESGRACDYGSDGYRPDQAFCVHFKRLGERLAAWDAVAAAPAMSEHALDQQLDAMMAEREVTATEAEVSYNLQPIKSYARVVAMEHASGRLPEAPHFEWRGFTTAGHPDVPGPPYGVLMVNGSETDWISLTPLDGETEADWLARIEPYKQRVDDLLAAAHADALPCAEAVLTAQEGLREFARDSAPAILDALRLVQDREAPRIRHRCESC